MASNTIQIKAMTKEEAIQRALKIFEAKEEHIMNIVELQKGKSLFWGLVTKEGLYSIEIDKTKKIITPVMLKENNVALNSLVCMYR